VTRTGKTFTRVDLYEAAYRTLNLPRAESTALVELILKEIADCLQKGENVKLTRFGSFLIRGKGQRTGRNPRTGNEVPIPPRRVILFKPSANMKRQVNLSKPVVGATSNTAVAELPAEGAPSRLATKSVPFD
jgi:integration host factor subunit alpha